MSRFKSAVYLSGHVRGYKNAYESFKKNFYLPLLDVSDIDIFISTWERYDCNDTPGFVENRLKADPNKYIDIFDLLAKYNPINIIVNNYNKYKPHFHYGFYVDKKPPDYPNYVINDTLIAAPQLFGIWQCNEMRKIYCAQTKNQYDLVFRVRPDFSFNTQLSVEISDKIKLPILWREPYKQTNKEWIYAIDDRFAYGPTNLMDIYCDTYLNIEELIKSWNYELFPYTHNETNSQQLSNERILHRNLAKNNVGMQEQYLNLTRAVYN